MCIYKVRGGRRCARTAIVPVGAPRYCKRHFEKMIVERVSRMTGGRVRTVGGAILYIQNAEFKKKYPAGWKEGQVDGKDYYLTRQSEAFKEGKKSPIKTVKNAKVIVPESSAPNGTGPTRGGEKFPPGLQNCGATCYMNSANQLLFSIEHLREFIIKNVDGYIGKSLYLRDYANLLKYMENKSSNTLKSVQSIRQSETIDGKEFRDIVGELLIEGGTFRTQQDASEYITAKVMGKAYPYLVSPSNEEALTDAFIHSYYNRDKEMKPGVNFLYARQLIYYKYKGRTKQLEETSPVGNLDITIRDAKDCKNVAEVLTNITAGYGICIPETVDPPDPTVGTFTNGTSITIPVGATYERCTKIEELQDYFLVTLKVFDYTSGARKVTDFGSSGDLIISEEFNNYELISMIGHQGSGPFVGHYVCFRKINGAWYEYNDARVYPVANPSSVLHMKAEFTPYILLYKQLDA